MSRACYLALASLLCAACSNDIEPVQPLLNRCAQDIECAKGDHCHPELALCVRKTPQEPYAYALQVVPNSGELVSNLTLDNLWLNGSAELGKISIPNARNLSGRVLFDGREREAELIFFPRTLRPYLVAPLSTITLPNTDGKSLGFRVRLEPNTEYDVEVYPVGPDSKLLPPQRFSFTETRSDEAIDFTYEATDVQPLHAQIFDENAIPPAGLKLRLRDPITQHTVSSLGTVNTDGSFTLYASTSVLGQLAKHQLQLGLEKQGVPWLTTITLDGTRLHEGATVVIPVIPARVPFVARVEIDENTGITNATAIFQSTFPRPPSPMQVNGRDWCTSRLVPDAGIACSANLTVSLGPESTLSTELLPGDYQVFIRPSSDSEEPQRAGTTHIRNPPGVTTQPSNAPQSGWQFKLQPGKSVSGDISSPLRQPMPFVNVTAYALGIASPETGAVGRFNRTAEALSDSKGRFKLAVDVGYYDFVARPPSGSGFAWITLPNRYVKDLATKALTLKPSAPVISRGKLVTDKGRPIGRARIDAFAIVTDLNKTTDDSSQPLPKRALRIGQAFSDDAGVFVLHLPSHIGPGDGDSASDAGLVYDAGLSMDAGLSPAQAQR